MKRTLFPFITLLVPLLAVTSTSARAQEGGFPTAFQGVDVTRVTTNPDGSRVAHLHVQVGATQYVEPADLAKALGTNVTSIREQNMGTTLANCLNPDKTSAMSGRTKLPPNATPEDVIAMRSSNGLWAGCSRSPELQLLAFVQGEHMTIQIGHAALTTTERLNLIEEGKKDCTTPECAAKILRKLGARIPEGDAAAEEKELLAKAEDDVRAKQRAAEAEEAQKKTKAALDAVQARVNAAQAKANTAEKKLSSRVRVELTVGIIIALIFIGLLLGFRGEINGRDRKAEERSEKRWKQNVVDAENLGREHLAEAERNANAVLTAKQAELEAQRSRAVTAEGIVHDKELEILALTGQLRDRDARLMELDISSQTAAAAADVRERQLQGDVSEAQTKLEELRAKLEGSEAENARLTKSVGDLNIARDQLYAELNQSNTERGRLEHELQLQDARLAQSDMSVQKLIKEAMQNAETLSQHEARIQCLLDEANMAAEQHRAALAGRDENAIKLLRLLEDKELEIASLKNKFTTPDLSTGELEMAPVSDRSRELLLCSFWELLGILYRDIMGRELMPHGDNPGLEIAETFDTMRKQFKELLSGRAETAAIHAMNNVRTDIISLAVAVYGTPTVHLGEDMDIGRYLQQTAEDVLSIRTRLQKLLMELAFLLDKGENVALGPDMDVAQLLQQLTQDVRILSERGDSTPPPETGSMPVASQVPRTNTAPGLGAPAEIEIDIDVEMEGERVAS